MNDAVRAARVNIVFSGQPVALPMSVVLAAITVAVMLKAASRVSLCLWLGVLVALSGLRAVMYWRYRRERHAGTADLSVWERRFHLGCLAAGAVWGSSALLFFPADPTLQVFLAFVLAGVSAGATTELAVMPRTAHAFVIPCVLPLALRFFLQGDLLHIGMGTMGSLYIGLIVSAGRRGHAQLTQTVAAQMEARASRLALHDSETHLRASEERLRLAIEAGQIGVWDWDILANVLLWDSRMYEMYRIVPLAGTNNYEMWRQRVHPADLARVESALNRTRAGHREFESEFRILWPDGEERTIKSVARAVCGADGKATRLTGINLDMTELKRVERMKSEFVSTVSHELRTPLTSIRGSLGLLASHAGGAMAPQKAQELLQMAARNADRLAALIDDLLDIDKMESGKLRFELEPQLLLPLIEQSIAGNAAYAVAHQVALAIVEPRAPVWVAVDGKRCLQVMANLLSNAVKFSPAGACVEVAVLRREEWARVEVRDRGRGISEEFKAKIFGKFSQADASDARQKGGTGLGLAISKAMIEQMNGRIGFETEPGAGTTFFFELPAIEAAIASEA